LSDTPCPELSGQALTRAIGRRLARTRVSRGLTLAQLAERTNGVCSKSQISNYERGIRRMSVESAWALAAALGDITPAWLLFLDEGPCPGHASSSDATEAPRKRD
jgi:transcriptional regulator with XRE-family HTH domain